MAGVDKGTASGDDGNGASDGIGGTSEPSTPTRPTDDPDVDLTVVGVNQWNADLRTRQIVMSRGIAGLFGLPGETPTQLDEIEARYHPDDAARAIAATDAALADPGRGFLRDSFRMLKADGSIVWLELRGVIYRDSAGRAIRTAGLLLDITELKEREQALETSRRRLEVALADTAITLFQQNRALRYTWIHNPTIGYDTAAVLGRTDAELMPANSATEVEALKRQVIETGKAVREVVTIETDQGTFRFDVHLEPLRDVAGDIVGLTGASFALNGKKSLAADLLASENRDLLLDKLAERPPQPVKNAEPLSRGITALVRKFTGIGLLAEEDIPRLAALEQRQQLVPARVPLVDGETIGRPPVVIGNGWAHSYHLLADGSRQIIDFHLPGDLVGSHFGVIPVPGTVAVTLTDCLVGKLDERALEQLEHAPGRLSQLLHWSGAREKAIIQQHLVSTGRRSAMAGLAHLLLELGERLKLVLLAGDDGFRCPLTQEHLADALGLTSIHVNRMLRELRRMGALTFKQGYVAFHDRDRLVQLAGFEPSFLAPLRLSTGKGMTTTD